MKLILNNNLITVSQSKREPIEEIKITIDTTLVDFVYNKVRITFDGKEYEEYTEGMHIPSRYFSLNKFNIAIKLINNSTFKKFNSDTIALSKIITLGMTDEIAYPKSIQSLESRVTLLESEFVRLLASTKTLKQVVKDIYEEGDII